MRNEAQKFVHKGGADKKLDQILVRKGVRTVYSREEKMEIVEAFLASGLTAAEAGRKQGWPARATLSGWVDEARRGELPVAVAEPKGHAGARKRHERYPDETRARAAALYERGRRPAEIARLLGIDCRHNVRSWWKRSRESGKLAGRGFEPKPASGAEEAPAVAAKGKREVPPEVAALSEAELENACLRAVLADLKAGGWDPASISNGRKCELGERLRRETGRPLREITRFLGISKSSYEYHRARMGEPDPLAGLKARMRELFSESRGRYGYRRIWALLRREGTRVSEKVVRRIMREEGLAVRYEPKARRWSSYAGENGWAPPNLVGRDFRSGLPNFLWLTDITQFGLPSFKCYLSAVVDRFDGRVAGWRVSERPDAELADSTLEGALAGLSPHERPVVHSDRGCHYRWPGWVALCESRGLVRSMSAKGCSPDNSAMEGFFGRLKNEFFHHRDWSGATFESFAGELGAYIGWYNSTRVKESLGWMSPDEFRRSLGLAA